MDEQKEKTAQEEQPSARHVLTAECKTVHTFESTTDDLEKVILTNDESLYQKFIDGGAIILFHPILVGETDQCESGLSHVYLVGIPRGKSLGL